MSSIHALLDPEPSLETVNKNDTTQLNSSPTLSPSNLNGQQPLAGESLEGEKETFPTIEASENDVGNDNTQEPAENNDNQEDVEQQKYHDLDLKFFRRKTKKALLGFGERSFPPMLNTETAQYFQSKTNVPPGSVEAKHASLAKCYLYPKSFKCTKDQKMRGYIVNKTFKPRSWKAESVSIPLSDGGALVTARYATKTPHMSMHRLPYRELPGLKQNYRVSTLMRPIMPTLPPLNFAPPVQPYNRFPSTLPNGTSSVSRSGREKAQCTEPTCLKFFADRSSLRRHRRRMHPELVNPGSKLATHN